MYSKKQNLDPNRSTKTSSNSNFTHQNKSYYHRDSIYQKQKLNHNLNHNKSHQVNSQSLIHNHNKSYNKSIKNTSQQHSDNNKQNLNSKILAQFKKQQNQITSKSSKINGIGSNNNSSAVLFKQKQSFNLKQEGTKTNLSTTRSNYKPKFILKDLMMQQLQQQSKEQRIQQHLFSNDDNEEYEEQQNQFFKFRDNQRNQRNRYGKRNYKQQEQQSVCQQYFKNKSQEYPQNPKKNRNSIKFLRFKEHPYLSQQISQEQKNRNQQSSDIDQNNISNTFTNSPIASQNYYFCNFKKSNHNLVDHHQNNNKSAILSKRTYVEEDTRNTEQNNCRHNSKEGIVNRNRNVKQISKTNTKKNLNNNNNKLRTEENIQQQDYQTDYHRQNYDQGSTISYANTKRSTTNRLNNNFHQNIKKSTKNLHNNQSLPKQGTQNQTRIRALSQVSNNKSTTHPNNLLIQKPQNYKIPYLQTKKQLQIRTAYFNQAIQLCKLVISNMKQVLTEQYHENQNQENGQSGSNSKSKKSSERIMWVTDRCDQLLKTFDEYDGGK